MRDRLCRLRADDAILPPLSIVAREHAVNKKRLFWITFGAALLIFAAIQFVPAPPVVVPAELPPGDRVAHRLLNFEGIANFRDLGGYPAADGRRVRWGALYRSGTLHQATRADVEAVAELDINRLIDLRSAAEKEEEPDRLPEPPRFQVVELPILDDGNNAMVGEIMERIENGDFEGFDPHALMLEANRQFATQFTPQYQQFIRNIIQADGAPVLWHCSAGKDRAGFAAAILLRLLGVSQEIVMQDYLASKQHALAARESQLRLLGLFKGDEAASQLAVLMGVEEAWLAAGFAAIDEHWGGFDNYVREGLGLSAADVENLRNTLLE